MTLRPGQKIVSNEYVGQAYLAIALKKPGDGRGRKYKVWADYYSQIFRGGIIEPHVICLEISVAAHTWSRTARRHRNITETRQKLLNKGVFHIARMAAFLWRGSDALNQGDTVLQTQITTLREAPETLNPHFDEALNRLETLISANPDFASDIDASLKSALFDTSITRALHTPVN